MLALLAQALAQDLDVGRSCSGGVTAQCARCPLWIGSRHPERCCMSTNSSHACKGGPCVHHKHHTATYEACVLCLEREAAHASLHNEPFLSKCGGLGRQCFVPACPRRGSSAFMTMLSHTCLLYTLLQCCRAAQALLVDNTVLVVRSVSSYVCRVLVAVCNVALTYLTA